MELKEDEGQVCRLCGQCGSIYMDVFGEEGTKRFLGFKIHSKINILIDERDPLPKAICVQCLGKLEFVCDFQEECLRTQQLLRDQYNLPSLTDIEENKPEDSAPSTSTTSTENNIINNKENTAENSINNDNSIDSNINNNNNNNNSNKNYNPPENELSKDDSRAARNTTKLQRNLRSQQNQLKTVIKKDSQKSEIFNSDEDVIINIQQPELSTTTKRKLRSRQSIEGQVPSNEVSEIDTNSKVLKSASTTKKRLKKHNISIDTTINSNDTPNQNVGKKNEQVDIINTIQIPTNTLNKVLSAITNAPGIGVSVKEPINRSSDAEDISFTVELCKKQETDSLTVVAKVFPDQGSCLVDKSIVTFLEEGTNEEVNTLVNNIVSPNTPKNKSRSLIDKLQNAEDITSNSRNPEELFKMDGEEIHVDDNVEQITVNDNQIKPDDGLPQVICMRCLGTIEFWCDFRNMCHDTQKNLETNGENVNDKDAPKEKLESDTESDKENVLPVKNGKRKGKVLHPEETKLTKSIETDENTNLEEESAISNESSLEKSSDSLNSSAVNLPVINKNLDIAQENLNAASCHKKIVEKELYLGESTVNDVVSANSKQESRDINRLSRFTKREKEEKKLNRCSKTSPSIKIKSKKTNVKSMNKTIDKYFNTQSQYKKKNTDEENLNPNHTKEIFNSNANDEMQENIIFEGTVIDSTGDSSIVMPLKMEISNSIKLDNVVMADGNEIVQAEEIVWISSNPQLPEPQKPKSIKNQSKIASPAPGDEAEAVEKDGTVLIQTSGHDVNSASSTEQLIVLEVQLPAKDNSVALQKNVALLKRNRSLSLASSRKSSEGKYAKISELMTEEQKNEIETHYKIEMSLVDDAKVAENVIILDKSKYQCKICQVTYPRLDKCQVHIWRHLDMKPFLCKTCDFSTLTVSNIRCHIRKSHLKIKPFGCHLCNKSYNSATLLEEHLNIHTGTRPFQCDFCDFASTSKQILAHHILIHKEVKDVKCDICGKAFYSKGRMRAHKVTHNKDQAFKCTLCSTYLSHKEALEKHYENVHKKDYICKICSKVYKSRKALHNHESVHSAAKFKCPMCPNVYKSTHILKEHILKHQGIRQYKCNSCDKSFAQQSHLAAHMAVHSNITYNCPGCQKGFNRHDNMKVHTKRCEKFLADPSLQKLLTKRKISFSRNNTAKINIHKDDEQNIYQKEKKNFINISTEVETEDSMLGIHQLMETEKEITTENF